jgi:small subunit ribosomal protein S9
VTEESAPPEDEQDVPSETTPGEDETSADPPESESEQPEPEPEPEPEPQPEPVAAAEDEATPDEIDEPADGVIAEEATSEEPEATETVEVPAPAATEDIVVEDATEIVEGDIEEVEVAPRAKPEIPGADLIPDIIPEGDEFLDAEAQAAAEAEAEAAAAREAEADQAVAQPIADAAIDLAAGARYTATGKRKTAVARVILKPGNGTYSINGKVLEVAFPRDTLQRVIRQPLEAVGYESRMDVVARMHGGGVAAQAGALRHGISRALLEADPHLRGELKRRGFLTRDPRVKERKKAGLKKARKRPQFSKR